MTDKIIKYTNWKMAFVLSIIILVATNAFQLYHNIDSAVSKTYSNVTIETQEKDLQLLMKLIPRLSKDYSKKDFVYLIRQSAPDAFVVDDDSTITVGQINFQFNSIGKLGSVSQY